MTTTNLLTDPALLGLRPRSFDIHTDHETREWHRAIWAQYRVVAHEQGISLASVAFLGMASIVLAQCEGDDELVRLIGGSIAGALGQPIPDPGGGADVAYLQTLAQKILVFLVAERPSSAA